MVIQVDDSDSEINLAKNSIVQDVYLSEQEVKLLFEKITQRALLNHKLKQVRESESLMLYVLFIILWFDI